MQAKTAMALVALLVLCTPAAAQPSPAAPWPIQAQGRALPRPDWVLAIPARRQADGSLSIWDRADEWTSAWRVPAVADGLRVVTLLGDTEDRRTITSAAIDGMMVDDLSKVLRKYGAPAMALVVTDGSSVAVAGYVPGWQASWESVPWTGDTASTRELSLDAIAGLFDGAGQASPQTDASASGMSGILIDAYRVDQSTGATDYRIIVYGTPQEIDFQLDTVAAMPGILILSETLVDGYSVIAEIRTVPTASGGPLEMELPRYGLTVLSR